MNDRNNELRYSKGRMMAADNPHNSSMLKLITVLFFLILGLSVRGFLATMTALAIRQGTDDWQTVMCVLSFQAPLTLFETLTLLLNAFGSVVTLVGFIICLVLIYKDRQKTIKKGS